MGLNVFDIVGGILGVIGALIPLVQVPLAITADKRRSQPRQEQLHMMHRQTRHNYKR